MRTQELIPRPSGTPFKGGPKTIHIMQEAQLIEIFSSFQGEGPYVGQAMTFVRFQHCAFSCQYCDTPDSFKKLSHYRVEFPQGSGQLENYPNPASPEALNQWLQKFANPIISLTGGEPLHHSRFLADWLPSLKKKYRILLETSGILFKDLERVLPHLDIVSMDLKLPSVTGMKPYWEEHQKFIELATNRELYLKVVVGELTPQEEWQRAVDLAEELAPDVPFILQPLNPRSPADRPISTSKLKDYFDQAREKLKDVRVIPQIHVQAQWL